jgi:hypothetical protein
MIKKLSNNLMQSWTCQVDMQFTGRGKAIFYKAHVRSDFSLILHMIKQVPRELIHSIFQLRILPMEEENTIYYQLEFLYLKSSDF